MNEGMSEINDEMLGYFIWTFLPYMSFPIAIYYYTEQKCKLDTPNFCAKFSISDIRQ